MQQRLSLTLTLVDGEGRGSTRRFVNLGQEQVTAVDRQVLEERLATAKDGWGTNAWLGNTDNDTDKSEV